MDEYRRRQQAEEGTSVDGSTLARASDHNSKSKNILYTLRQISQVLNTILSFIPGFIVPEVRDWITTAGMGKKFNPATDIGSLEGKVILVTGGMAPPLALLQSRLAILTARLQATQVLENRL